MAAKETNTSPNKISFIIASVDRAQQLQQCIDSVEKAHEYKKDIPVEVLAVIQKAKQKKDIRVRYPGITTFYYIDKIGLSVARNFGIEKSKGDYLVFLDDDAAVNEDFIDVLSKKVLLYDDVGAFCGRLLDVDKKTPFSVLFYNNQIKKLRRLDYQNFMGSAHVLSRKVIKKIGGYDERFGVGSEYYHGGEETDIFFRLKVANEQVIYLPDLIFFHPILIVPPSYTDNYGHAFGALLTKSCLNDRVYFFVYIFIFLQRTIKAYIRILQKMIFKGKYIEKDKKYHYGDLLRGTYRGIKDFINNEL